MNQKKDKINVIIIDTSVVARYLLTEILEQAGDIAVVASVSDASDALNKVMNHNPHVITLDVAMTGKGSLTFMEKLMELHPTPVVIISEMHSSRIESVLKAMDLGAVSYVGKRYTESWSGLLNLADEIVEKVRAASAMQVRAVAPTNGRSESKTI